MADFEDKVYAITGAASGIGFALATHLLARGARISIADSNRAALHHAVLELEKEHRGTSEFVFPMEVDVRKPRAVVSWLEQTIEKFGQLDGAANLAGVPPVFAHPTRDMEDEDWDTVIGVNLNGTKNCVKAELRLMKEGASIVNTASAAGLKGVVNGAAYAVSKAGIVALTKCAAKEEGKRGIRVNCIAPGFIDSPMVDRLEAGTDKDKVRAMIASAPMARKGTAAEVAKLITFLLGDDSSFVTGGVHVVDGGYTA